MSGGLLLLVEDFFCIRFVRTPALVQAGVHLVLCVSDRETYQNYKH